MLTLNNLIIEITRKCNLQCNHCLRGTAENKNITKETLEKFLLNNDIKYISMVSFTGGEPSLNTQAIEDFIAICKENNIEIGSFYIATNGVEAKEKFLKVLLDLYLFCSDNEVSQVEISRSDFHDPQDEAWIDKLKCLRFVNERDILDYKSIISEGKGKRLNELNGTIDQARKIEIYPLEVEDNERIDGEVYLNVNGDICASCNLSYARQVKNRLGNIHNSTLLEMLQKAI